MNQDINYIINKIKRNKVLVVGDIILDCSIDGEISGLSAEAPIMTFREHKVTYTLGGAANVALNLKNAHQDVFLVSIVGSDDSAKTIKSLLHNADISSDGLIVDVTRRTTVKKRYYTKLKEQIFRSDNEDCFEIERRIEELIVEKITERIDCVDVVVLSDYLKGCLTRNLIKSIVCLAHQKGIKVIVDPKDADFSKYANCDVLKPNKKELALMLNKSSLTYTDILVGSKRICEENNHNMVVVTMGADGMFLYEKYGKTIKLEALKPNIVVDVSGAGDTAIAYLTIGIVSGMSVEETLVLANAASGKKVTKRGAVPVNYIELLSFSKRIERNQVSLLRKALLNKRIVFTNGCFDLLHAGHIYNLSRAKSFGDVLVVGINSDESVKRLKGENRPIISLVDRIQMLEALSCVDYIIPFTDDTPIEIIKTLMPQVLVKGEEYKTKTVVGADYVIANGGEVKFIEMYKGFSTSDIVKRIGKNE